MGAAIPTTIKIVVLGFTSTGHERTKTLWRVCTATLQTTLPVELMEGKVYGFGGLPFTATKVHTDIVRQTEASHCVTQEVILVPLNAVVHRPELPRISDDESDLLFSALEREGFVITYGEPYPEQAFF